MESSKTLILLNKVKHNMQEGWEEGAGGDVRVGIGEGSEHTLVGRIAGWLEVVGGETVPAEGPAKH